ncbi:hypothetical protein SAMN05192559_11627 [Halobacillus karajensis]|uniref:hypothetical protein n=1 Tax=Halobacillus karajensis TaxID=195088 RepID=UPI0008A76C78|nr:hypothetical protein [Halobacillus karajensis]SEI13012.1 hypothetical protein SAMN05192559_11627 [Halobacillus karajensis]
MTTRVINIYRVFNYNKEQYSEIIQNIKYSRAFLSFIDSSKERGHGNKRFESYLDTKTHAYFLERGNETIDKGIGVRVDAESDRQKWRDFIETFGVDEDYYIAAINKHSKGLFLYEQNFYDEATYMDESFENTYREYLSNSFNQSNYERFTLLPFLGWYEGQLVTPIVQVSIHKSGIMSLYIQIKHQTDQIAKEEVPSYFSLDNVKFPVRKKEYRILDYALKVNKDNERVLPNDYNKGKSASIDEIVNVYIENIEVWGGVKDNLEEGVSSIGWIIINEDDHQEIHDQFVERNKLQYVKLLNNSSEALVNKYSTSKLDSILEEGKVYNTKSFSYFCNDVSNILSIESKELENSTRKSLVESEDMFRANGTYDLEYKKVYSRILCKMIADIIGFYELVLLKKAYLRNLLNNISSGEYGEINQYNRVKSELNHIRLKYDSDVMFQSEGSPKTIYNKIEILSGTSSLLNKVDYFVRELRDDIEKQNIEYGKEKNLSHRIFENNLVVLTLIFTSFMSYSGLDILLKNHLDPYVDWFSNWITFGIWLPLNIWIAFTVLMKKPRKKAHDN